MDAEARPSQADSTGAPPPTPQKERVGIFPSWGWVYGTVVVYGIVTVLFLLTLTRLLDFGATP